MIAYANPPRTPRPIAAEHAYIAQSPAGTYLRKLEEAQRAHLRQRAVFADLEALRTEAKQDDWAGREGKAIQPGSYLLARALLESLIPYFQTPELIAGDAPLCLRAKSARKAAKFRRAARPREANAARPLRGAAPAWGRRAPKPA